MKIAPILIIILFTAAMLLPQERGRRRKDTAPKVGEKAPDFKLRMMCDKKQSRDEEEKEEEKKVKYIKLSDFKDKQEVVLIFGSYT